MMIDNYECAGYTFYSKFDSGNLGKVELVRCCEGLGIVGSTVSSGPIGAGGPAVGGCSSNVGGVPIIGQTSIGGSSSASAIVAATLGVGLQQHGGGHTAHSGSGGAPQGGGLGLPIPSPTPHATENPLVEVEFNLWTRPDCAGTPYENQNRTWFHFAVTGGRPNQIVKFNVMNLNKQAKLFSQGMHPVMKVGPNGRWERIKDKPSYSITNDVFYISFLHKAPEVGAEQTRIYYAFTFPFTYTELLDQLATFDRKFGRHPFELNKMAYDVSQKYESAMTASGGSVSTHIPPDGGGVKLRRKGKLSKTERMDRTSPESFDDTARDGTTGLVVAAKQQPPLVSLPPEGKPPAAGVGMVIDDNTSESMQQITNLVNKVKIELPQQTTTEGTPPAPAPATLVKQVASTPGSTSASLTKLKLPSFHQQLSASSSSNTAPSATLPTDDDPGKGDQRDEIYYCRELLTHSVEGRRIELLTISSFHGIQTVREPRLRNLFPDDQAQRCHTFRDKKIVFISSRVHPGETPASFVLNGFLSMLLDRKSIVSQTLRRMYVFKVIPFLNPDGVYNGLYRSDTRGHNLNRVYLGPCHETQPAIYAARKLIRYYHLGADEVEPYELEREKKSSSPPKVESAAESLIDSNMAPADSGLAESSEAATTAAAAAPADAATVKKESDSVEQDNTPPASDSGFSEASTASSSKVVTMCSISSTGSTPPEATASVVTNQTPDSQPEDAGATATTATVAVPPSLMVAAATAAALVTTAPPLAPTKAFTEKLIPELNPVVVSDVSRSSSAVTVPRSSSSLSMVSGGGGGKKSTTGGGGSAKGAAKGPFHHKQQGVLSKPQFIGVTPGGALKFKEYLMHPLHHHHPHHHHHHHHHHAAGAAAAGGGTVSSGMMATGGQVGKFALGSTIKKAVQSSGKQSSSNASCSSASSLAGRTVGERILGDATGGKNRPQTPQQQAPVVGPSALPSHHYRSHRNEYLNPGGGGPPLLQRSLNISLDFLAQLDERNDRVVYEDRSNLFMYLDLHGHASKKGVFMYGNHLPSTVEAVECMLLPRLMSLNSAHFHFDACNFSERNMYYKGKRDGLSKEGSGRVAVYKCTGLIKSYTLECNYNTGKCVNILPPRGKEIVAKATHTLVPPKYTPGVFEEVGKALGPSILDLTNSNPLSRLSNCEFRTLQGLRNALRIEIERGSSKARVTNKGPKAHSKRLANQLSSSIEIAAKENAIQWVTTGPLAGGQPPVVVTSTGGNTGVTIASSPVVVAGGTMTLKVVTGAGSDETGAILTAATSGIASAQPVAAATGAQAVVGRTFLKGSSVKGGKISRKGGAFGKKKPKVLCDVGAAPGGVGGNAGNGKKLQELVVLRGNNKEQHPQSAQQQVVVPRKKIKVSTGVGAGVGGNGAPGGGGGGPPSSALELCFKGTLHGVGGGVVASSSLPNCSVAALTAAELGGAVAKKVKSETKLFDAADMLCDDGFDTALPCCSHGTATSRLVASVATATTPDHEVLLIGGGIGAGSQPIDGGGGTGSDSGGSGSKPGGVISGASLKPKPSKLAKSTKSGSSDASKKLLKKKRSLKSDSTGLKRKKTRIKPSLT
ncbi:uncharacterized protein LOC131216719 [Anopheles bellator]|uniref:uncharacterized protein LOC131216719 n=1 Tax=Anopheles bellator TaxID=139047 RepID=UPI0026479A1C|nr:uncharacterized protein LOC131216719 [Anopheles bellator]